jgi:hypothetical protein
MRTDVAIHSVAYDTGVNTLTESALCGKRRERTAQSLGDCAERIQNAVFHLRNCLDLSAV